MCLVCLVGPPLSNSETGPDGGLTLKGDVAEAGFNLTTGLEQLLVTITTMIPGVKVVVMGLIPPYKADEPALLAIRSLSERVRQLARDRGARFLDVEALLRRALSHVPSESVPWELSEDEEVSDQPWISGWCVGRPPPTSVSAERLRTHAAMRCILPRPPTPQLPPPPPQLPPPQLPPPDLEALYEENGGGNPCRPV